MHSGRAWTAQVQEVHVKWGAYVCRGTGDRPRQHVGSKGMTTQQMGVQIGKGERVRVAAGMQTGG